MKHVRRIPFLLFLACLVAAMPFAWGQVGLEDVYLEPSVSLSDEARIDALKVQVTLCHIPPGDPANAQTIVVGQAAVADHLAHGDYLGECHAVCEGVPSPVPKTGQTTCWDENVTPTDCAGTGQDGELQKGVSVAPRFTDNGDGTVKDNLTGLIWLKDANCFGYRSWTQALTASNTLASGACGLTDGSVAGAWRLPNVKELQSLIDYQNSNPALPAGYPFSGVHSEYNFYWSSSTLVGYPYFPYFAWGVGLYDGNVDLGYKGNTDYVWPVRGGQ